MRPLKIAVIREEYFSLTGDHILAIILNQMVYWSQRVRDFDLFLEEAKLYELGGTISPLHGWIYKTVNDLLSETMLNLDRHTLRGKLGKLIEKGWLEERSNPDAKWDKVLQYRINLRRLQDDLQKIGYTIPGMTFMPNVEKMAQNPNGRKLPFEGCDSTIRMVDAPHSYTYTETTTEITNKDNDIVTILPSLDFSENEKDDEVDLMEMLSTWNHHMIEALPLTHARSERLALLLKDHFDGNMRGWSSFCDYIGSCEFLKGNNSYSFKISMEWLLKPDKQGEFTTNIEKVKSGKFHGGHEFLITESRDDKKKRILDTIEDAQWKEWCTIFLEDNSPLSLFKMEEISRAKMKEYDGKYVHIEAMDKEAYNAIEDFRMKFTSIIGSSYPDMKSFLTFVS